MLSETCEPPKPRLIVFIPGNALARSQYLMVELPTNRVEAGFGGRFAIGGFERRDVAREPRRIWIFLRKTRVNRRPAQPDRERDRRAEPPDSRCSCVGPSGPHGGCRHEAASIFERSRPGCDAKSDFRKMSGRAGLERRIGA